MSSNLVLRYQGHKNVCAQVIFISENLKINKVIFSNQSFSKNKVMNGMNKVFQIFFKWKFIIFVSIAFILSGCPLTVNLNISTDKPISLVIDKPIEMKVGADVAVTKLAPIKVGVTNTNK